MKPQQTVPLLTAAAPVALAVPPLAIAAIGVGLIWWLFREEKSETKLEGTQTPQAATLPKPERSPAVQTVPQPEPATVAEPKTTTAFLAVPPPPMQTARVPLPRSAPSATARRVTREDLAGALGYGERRFTRKEAVAALEALGFRKTAAYKALSIDGKFATLINCTPDGLIEWVG